MAEDFAPIKLAVVNHHLGGGATQVALEVMRWGPELGVQPTWFPMQAPAEEAKVLLQSLAALQPDLVHVHCWYQTWPYELLQQLGDLYPVAFTVHDVAVVNQYGIECWECYRNAYCFGCPALEPIRRFRPNYRMRDRWQRRRVNLKTKCHLVFPSHWMQRRLQRSEWSRLPGTVVPNGVDTERFAPASPPGARDKKESLEVLFVGNMYSASDHRKGLPDLLAAWPVIRSQLPKARLTIAGTVMGLDIPEGVRVLGELPNEELPNVYRAGDVFVLPSMGDNLPTTILEAHASGLPIVATKVGGIPEQVLEGQTGLLVPPGDAQALGSKIYDLLSDADLRLRMGEAGRQHIEANYSRSVAAYAHRQLYDRIIGTPGQR